MKKLAFLTLLFFAVSCEGGKKSSHKYCKTCGDFKTQAEAKKYAKSHKECKRRLDHDGDGKYCESLPKD